MKCVCTLACIVLRKMDPKWPPFYTFTRNSLCDFGYYIINIFCIKSVYFIKIKANYVYYKTKINHANITIQDGRQKITLDKKSKVNSLAQ